MCHERLGSIRGSQSHIEEVEKQQSFELLFLFGGILQRLVRFFLLRIRP